MANNEEFRNQLKKFMHSCRAQGERNAKRIVFVMFREINFETPVRSGQLRNNWRITTGNPWVDFDPARRGTDMRALSEALLWIETTTITGEIIHITNSTPYARRIEFGYYSIQKPEGMLRVAYRRVVQWIRQKVL